MMPMEACTLFYDLRWQNLETQRITHKEVTAYKSFNCFTPDYLSSKFILRSDIFNSYNLGYSENRAVSVIVGSGQERSPDGSVVQ